MSEREIAIRLSGVKKMYKLGQIGGGTLTADLQSWWARIRGKEDPNSKIGSEQRLVGQTFMALNGIDLTIYKGEALGIIGGNGAGKSTMLKLLSRVTAPTEGEIGINGRIASMLEVGTGFNPEMTGRENVYMNGAILGMTKAEIDAKMEQIIEFSEVRDFIDTPVKRYSSGMFVKLAFSVAAHLDSEIMIMDEVLAVGDVNFQQKCLKKMRDVAMGEGRTVLYVSHNMNTIRQLCSRCIVLQAGKLVYEGDVEEAIRIYSKTCDVQVQKDYDLTQFDRTLYIKNGLEDVIRMQKVHIEQGALEQGQKLRFALTYQSKAAVEHLLLRLIVLAKSGEAIGMTYSQQFSCTPGENTVELELDTCNLAPGDFRVNVVMCEYDSGTQLRHDVVDDAFGFTVMETDIQYNVKWYRGWGNMRFDEAKLITE